jgi:hypothetical protein
VIWNKAKRKEYAKQMNLSEFEKNQLEDRRTGKSTRRAFLIFAECYEKPGQWIKIEDHASYYAPQASRFLMQMMQEMARALDFNFEWNRTNLTVRLPHD